MSNFVVCVSGGIASGKTFVSDQMAESGFAVIDADVVARQVVAAEQPALKKLVAYFGSEILLSDGSLDRQKLKAIVFNNKNKLAVLNQILHPVIQANIKEQLHIVKHRLIALVIPLFNESMVALYKIDRVLIVDVAEPIQQERLQGRDKMNAGLAKKIISAQSSREERLMYATDVIVNNDSKEQLRNRVNQLVGFFQGLRLKGKLALT